MRAGGNVACSVPEDAGRATTKPARYRPHAATRMRQGQRGQLLAACASVAWYRWWARAGEGDASLVGRERLVSGCHGHWARARACGRRTHTFTGRGTGSGVRRLLPLAGYDRGRIAARRHVEGDGDGDVRLHNIRRPVQPCWRRSSRWARSVRVASSRRRYSIGHASQRSSNSTNLISANSSLMYSRGGSTSCSSRSSRFRELVRAAAQLTFDSELVEPSPHRLVLGLEIAVHSGEARRHGLVQRRQSGALLAVHTSR